MFSYSLWRQTPINTRIEIARVFGIAKIGSTHVVNNVVESDGYKVEDVDRALNVESIQNYTNSKETDPNVLWELLVAKASGSELITNDSRVGTLIVTKPIHEEVKIEGAEDTGKIDIKTAVETSPKKRGRPAKKTAGK